MVRSTRSRRRRRELLVVPGVVLHPVLVVAAAAGGAVLNADGPGWARPIAVALTVLGVLGWVSGILLPGRLVLSFLASVAAAVALGAVTLHVDLTTLATRGVTDSCAVLDVDQQVHWSHDADGHDSMDVDYLHHLDCRDHGPRTTRWDRREGDAGQVLLVVFDPDERTGPEPASRLRSSGGGRVPTAWIALAVAVALRIGTVLPIGRRR